MRDNEDEWIHDKGAIMRFLKSTNLNTLKNLRVVTTYSFCMYGVFIDTGSPYSKYLTQANTLDSANKLVEKIQSWIDKLKKQKQNEN